MPSTKPPIDGRSSVPTGAWEGVGITTCTGKETEIQGHMGQQGEQEASKADGSALGLAAY